MSVIIHLSNNNAYPKYDGLAIKEQGETVNVLTVPVESEICLCSIECDVYNKVFWDDDGSERRNDKTSMLFAKQRNSDTVIMELLKNEIKIGDLNSDTFGEFYNGFNGKPLYTGYVVDWMKVYLAEGNGEYRIKTTLNILGSESVIESPIFYLSKYSDENADGTIRLEFWNKGNILGSDVDYTDLLPDGWYSSYRIGGFFGKKKPILEQDNFIDSSYNIVQIQDKIISEYTLITKYISAEFANDIFFRDVLSNVIKISDYNIINAELYNQIDVVPVEVSDVIYKTKGTVVRHEWKFKERIENNIKTNY